MFQWIVQNRLPLTIVFIIVATGAFAYMELPPYSVSDDAYDETTVTIYGQDGEELGVVDVRIADTREKRWVGLSDTESLDTNEGMLFVHDETDTQTYVMRDMSFPIDIIFISEDGTITEIHHADLPTDGDSPRYTGDGKYVLEVQKHWTTDNNVTTGDTVNIPEM